VRTLALAAALLACVVSAHADEPPSALVRAETPREGSLPDLVTAYGTAAPASNASAIISLQQDGRVAAVAVTLGEAVRANQPLLDFAFSAASASTYQQAVNALSLARTQRDHTAQLLTQQLATRDQLTQAEHALADAQTALDALQREGAGRSVQTLTAPFDGIITAVQVTPGERVQPGAPLLTLARLDRLIVTVGIEPDQRNRVTAGRPVRLEPLASGPPVEGKVTRVDAMLNPKTRLIDTDVAVPPGSVLPGSSFRAEITVGELRGFVVPRDAVLTDDRGAYVFQLAADKAVRVEVGLAGGNNQSDVITGSIDPTRKLVIDGNYQLEDGMKVREHAAKDAAR
jgi:membrane fusion protein (multidrug efflux system)